MCQVLQVSRPGYHAWCRREPSRRALANQELLVRLRQIFQQHRGRYGYRRVYEAVRQEVPYGIHRGVRLVDQLTSDALQMAPERRRLAPALVHHFDRGVQDASQDCRSLLLRNKVGIGMSHRGNA
jgi:transposase InsO family protein